jgi:oligopeptide transport system permease protein
MKSFWQRSKRFRLHRPAALGLAFILTIATLSIFAPWVTRQSYEIQNISDQLQGPSIRHLMGTDSLGRDLYSRILYGGRMSLAVGIATALFSLILGTFTGALAGFYSGWVDRILMRVVDFFYIFPMLLTATLLTLVLGRGFTGIFAAIGLTAWVTQARLIRGLVLQAKEQTYVESARALGVTDFGILFRHILPNLAGPIIVSLTFQIPTNILAESFLSFMGLGLQPPLASWGTLSNEGYRAMQSYPHLILFPGTMLFLLMLAFHNVGEGLRLFMDPHWNPSTTERI